MRGFVQIECTQCRGRKSNDWGGREWFGLRNMKFGSWNVKERQIICESFRRVKQVGIRSEWS